MQKEAAPVGGNAEDGEDTAIRTSSNILRQRTPPTASASASASAGENDACAGGQDVKSSSEADLLFIQPRRELVLSMLEHMIQA